MASAPLGVLGEPAAPDLLDLLQQVEVDALLVHHEAGGVGGGDHGRPELLGLLDRVQGDVPGAGDGDPQAVQLLAPGAQHLGGEQHAAVAGGLGPGLGAAPADALAGQHARLVAVGDPLVLAEQVADLPAADADVPGRDVGVLAEVAVQLGHEGLAEAHDLGVRAALGVEVRAALAAADAEAGQRVLEDLLEAEELHDPEVHRGVEPQPALVRAEGAVELHPEAPVDVHPAPVVRPRHPEHHLALGLHDPLDDPRLDQLRPRRQHRSERLHHLPHGLVELGLAGVAAQHLGEQRLKSGVLGVVGRDGHRGSRHLVSTFHGGGRKTGAPPPGGDAGGPLAIEGVTARNNTSAATPDRSQASVSHRSPGFVRPYRSRPDLGFRFVSGANRPYTSGRAVVQIGTT